VDAARALAFMALVLCNLALIFTNRSATRFIPSMLKVPNPALWWISGGTVAMLVLVMFSPFFQALFQFETAPLGHLVTCLGASVLCTLVLEGLKIPALRRAAGRRLPAPGRDQSL
jgi:Ca2+-transporting ATPase